MGDRGAGALSLISLLAVLACAPAPAPEVEVVLPAAAHASPVRLHELTWPTNHASGCVWLSDPVRALAMGTAEVALVEVAVDGVRVSGQVVLPLHAGVPQEDAAGLRDAVAAHLDAVIALEARCGPADPSVLVAADARLHLSTWAVVDQALRDAGARRVLLVVDDPAPQPRPSPAALHELSLPGTDTLGQAVGRLDQDLGQGLESQWTVTIGPRAYLAAALPASRALTDPVPVLSLQPAAVRETLVVELEPVRPEVDCLVVSPALGAEGAAHGIRALTHQRLEVGRGRLPEEVLVVPPGGSLALPPHGPVGPPPAGVLVEEDVVRAPVEAEGAAFTLASEEGEPLFVAIGELGVRNLRAWESWGPHRDAMGVEPVLSQVDCADCAIHHLEAELLTLQVDDLDHDGRGEAVLTTLVRALGEDDQVVGTAVELGVVWPRGRRTVLPLGVDPLHLPELWVVPPALNRGRPMLLEVASWGAPPPVRAWDLSGVGTASPRLDAPVGGHLCLRPGQGRDPAELVRVRP